MDLSPNRKLSDEEVQSLLEKNIINLEQKVWGLVIKNKKMAENGSLYFIENTKETLDVYFKNLSDLYFEYACITSMQVDRLNYALIAVGLNPDIKVIKRGSILEGYSTSIIKTPEGITLHYRYADSYYFERDSLRMSTDEVFLQRTKNIHSLIEDTKSNGKMIKIIVL